MSQTRISGQNEPPDQDAGARIRQEAEASAAAFPALLAEAELLAHTVSTGLHGRRLAGPGENFWQHRPYAFGDSVSMIDWRQSARSADRLLVRQNEWEASAPVWIWRDPSATLDFSSSPNLPKKRRRADILATALAILLARGGERVGLIGGRDRPFTGRGTPSLFLEALLHLQEGLPAPDVVQCGPGSVVVFISDFFFEDHETTDNRSDAPSRLSSSMNAYVAQGARGLLLQTVDPCEEDFPFSGRVEFEDPASRTRITIGAADRKSAEYRHQFAAHRDALKLTARGAGWSFIAHRTDAPATLALMSAYAHIAASLGTTGNALAAGGR